MANRHSKTPLVVCDTKTSAVLPRCQGVKIASLRSASKHSCDVGQLRSLLHPAPRVHIPRPLILSYAAQATREFKLKGLALGGMQLPKVLLKEISALFEPLAGGAGDCAVSGLCWQRASCLGACRRLLAEVLQLDSLFTADCSLAAIHKPKKISL